MDNLYFDDDTDIQAILTGKLTLVLLAAVYQWWLPYCGWTLCLEVLPRKIIFSFKKGLIVCQVTKDSLSCSVHQEFMFCKFQVISLSYSLCTSLSRAHNLSSQLRNGLQTNPSKYLQLTNGHFNHQSVLAN